MKSLLKILLIGICIFSIATPFSPAKETPKISTVYQLQTPSVFDITYVVYIWTPISTLFNPRYIDQFEFKAGDVFSAYTTKYGELTGTWIESDLGYGTWFQAWVIKEETSTTTTTPETTTSIPSLLSTGTSRLITTNGDKLKFDINIWGISFNYIPPAPFGTLTFSTILGYGAYLGVDVLFIGFANFPTEITCGSVTPSEAEQGETLSVTIGCSNANFRSAGTIKVSMGAGITVNGNPSVIDDKQISVNITIDSDADFSYARAVTISIDDIDITAATKFTILEQTT